MNALRDADPPYAFFLLVALVALTVGFCITPETKGPPAPDQPAENRWKPP